MASRLALVGLAVLVLFGIGAARMTGVAGPAREGPVAQWNRIGVAAGATLERGLQEQRALALMHLAIHDALQSIRPVYASYLPPRHAHPGALPDAAIATAAHDVLAATATGDRGEIDGAYARALEDMPEGTARSEGIRAGHEAAHDLLVLRAHDGADRADVPERGSPGTGRWEPTPPNRLPAMLPGWRDVTPFAMQAADQFQPPPPPTLDSAEYGRQYNAVKAYGGKDSASRTAAQGETARFWAGRVNDAWNEIARKTLARDATADGLAPWRHARTFALLNMAMADGFVAGWQGKYHYRYWRPVTAIHRAAADGNPSTVPDADWEAYLATPEHPEYPSTHSVLSGAAAATLRCAIGSARTDVAIANEGIVRRITAFDDAAAEIARSRVYAGAHFPIANAAGLAMGRRIGALACEDFLQPLARR